MPGLHPLAVWNRLRSTYWFLPALLTIAALAAAELLTYVDRSYPPSSPWLTWAYGGGADGARALLSAVAGSMITVVSVTFSVLVVALTVSSQHFGPRLLNSFMRDTASQLVLGTFTGTFAYCLAVLRTVQGDGGERYSVFVPHLAVTGSVALTLISVAMLIYYVHHVALSMQVSEITARVAADLESSIDRLYPEQIGESAEPIEPPTTPPSTALPVSSAANGYVRAVDGGALLELADGERTIIWVIARPGDFVLEGVPLAMVHPPPRDCERFAHRLRRAFTTGNDRSSEQDVAFAAQQLVEVALRALSPGVNEPFTAITCIDRLAQGMAQLAQRPVPRAVRAGADGSARVIAAPRRFCDLISDIFEPILLNAPVETPVVLERLAEVLSVLARAARRAEDVEAIGHLSTRLRTRVRDEDNPVRARIARGCDTVSEIVTASRHRLRRDSA